jgi:hypothetical protein
MAIYTPDLVTANALDITALETEMAGLAPRYYTASFSTVTSYDPTTDDTFAVISNLTATASLASDEAALVMANFSISAPDQADRWKLRLYSNTTPGTTQYYISQKTGDVTGEVDTIALMQLFTGLTGSVDFTAQWARNGASGDAIYSRGGNIVVMVTKTGT